MRFADRYSVESISTRPTSYVTTITEGSEIIFTLEDSYMSNYELIYSPRTDDDYLIIVTSGEPRHLLNLTRRTRIALPVSSVPAMMWCRDPTLLSDGVTLRVGVTRYHLDCETDEHVFYDFTNPDEGLPLLESDTIIRWSTIHGTSMTRWEIISYPDGKIEHCHYEAYYPSQDKLYCQLEFDRIEKYYETDFLIFHRKFDELLRDLPSEPIVVERITYQRCGNAIVRVNRYTHPNLEQHRLNEETVYEVDRTRKDKIL